ncbi:hypothetical protein FVER53590_30397 [Fusarium verticillioides]|nr:hypothetical protein FVER53590_30397 [Fusarium verticillioides]
MVTSAQFQLLNTWSKTIALQGLGENLQYSFPDLLYIRPQELSPEVEVAAGNFPTQSWIDLSFTGSLMRALLGRYPYENGIRVLKGVTAQATGIVAPVDPRNIRGWDFFILGLAGPGKLHETLNSIVNANKDPLVAFLNKRPLTLELSSFTLEFTNIKVEHLGFPFAAVSKTDDRSPWKMDLMLSLSGEAHLDASGSAISIPLKNRNIQVTNLNVQIGMTIDTTKSTEKDPLIPNLSVHRFLCAMEKLEGLPGIDRAWSYLIPAYLNTNYNTEIKEKVNAKLAEFLSRQGESARLQPLEGYKITKTPDTPPSFEDYREWMSTPKIQGKKLCELKIPGTHNSAAYAFEREISPILEDGLKILLNLRRGDAPSGHRIHDTEDIYIGSQAYDDLIDHITLLSQAHDETKNLKKQLEDGIRYLDLRIYWDDRIHDEGDYFIQHFLRGSRLDDLLKQVRDFVAQHSNSQEFIIVEFAQANFPGDVISEHSKKVAAKVRDILGPSVYMPPDAPVYPEPGNRYNFLDLKDVYLSSITRGSPKVLFVSRNACIYPHSILNVDDKSLQDPGEGSALYPYWFTQVPSNGEEVAHILLNTFSPSARIKNLRHTAYLNNATVETILDKNPPVWRYMMDWYTESETKKLPVDLIIKANL